jgi:hypothetical protein
MPGADSVVEVVHLTYWSWRTYMRRIITCLLLAGVLRGAELTAPHPFIPVITPPGFSKKATLVVEDKGADGKGMAILDAQGEWTPLGRYLYDLARDPALVAAHVNNLLSDPRNWPIEQSPLYQGPNAENQGHRFVRQIPGFVHVVRASKKFPQAVKDELLPRGWQDACETVFRDRLNGDGLLAAGDHVATMALSFHFLRTGWAAMGLRPERIYSLEHAQDLVRHLLTCPYIINDQDRWLSVDDTFRKRFPIAVDQDPLLVTDGKALFTGGLFIGWKTTLPSLHATWDGLTTLNTLFAFYPEADPTKPGSIFYRWQQLPGEQRAIAARTFALLTKRLWTGYHDYRDPTWCRIIGGKPVPGLDGTAEVDQLLDHAGYTRKDMTAWAESCWQEVYGQPKRNTTNGVQALLAILDGRVLSQLQVPTGEQKKPADDDDE